MPNGESLRGTPCLSRNGLTVSQRPPLAFSPFQPPKPRAKPGSLGTTGKATCSPPPVNPATTPSYLYLPMAADSLFGRRYRPVAVRVCARHHYQAHIRKPGVCPVLVRGRKPHHIHFASHERLWYLPGSFQRSRARGVAVPVPGSQGLCQLDPRRQIRPVQQLYSGEAHRPHDLTYRRFGSGS